jgi:hypothetical protein
MVPRNIGSQEKGYSFMAKSETRVVNIKDKVAYDVYIGRNIRFQPQYKKSPFANPFRIGKDG